MVGRATVHSTPSAVAFAHPIVAITAFACLGHLPLTRLDKGQAYANKASFDASRLSSSTLLPQNRPSNSH